jgi:hypothetical protein
LKKKILVVFLLGIFVASTLTGAVSATKLETNTKAMAVKAGVRPMAKGGVPGPPPGKGGGGGEEEGPDLSKPNKWAVLVGIADYRGRQNDLWHPDEDAQDMYTVLTTQYGFAEDHIQLLQNNKAKADQIDQAIKWLGEWANSTSTVVFIFSGHGAQVDDNWDTDQEPDGIDECIVSWDMYGITDGYLAELFASFDSQKIMVWFGSCFSGGMNDISNTETFDGVLCSACQEDQYGYDVYEMGNTLFGYYYIDQGMLNGHADSNNDEVVTVEEAFYYADSLVQAFVEEKQLTTSDPFMDDRYDLDLYL